MQIPTLITYPTYFISRIYLLAFTLLIYVSGLAQSIPTLPNQIDADGRKQGKWAIMYNNEGEIVNDVQQAASYRLITYQDGKPMGIVKDYYTSGFTKMIADSLLSEDPIKYEGKVVFYSEEKNITDFKYYKGGSLKRDTTVQLFLKILEKQAGEISVHADQAEANNNLAELYHDQGQYKEAEPFYVKAKNIYEKAFGKNHPKYALVCNNLSLLFQDQGLYAKAEPLAKEAKDIYQKVLGNNHSEYGLACNNLALLYWKQGIYKDAERLYLEARAIWAKSEGKNSFKYAFISNNLAMVYRDQKLHKKAEPLYLETKDILGNILGENHPQYALVCNNIGLFYFDQKLYAKAETLYLKAKSVWEKTLGKEHPYYIIARSNLALLYHTQGLYEQAEPSYLDVVNIRKELLGVHHLDYAISCNNLGILYFDQHKYELAEPWFKEANKVWIKQTENNFVNLSEKEKAQFLNTFKKYFEMYYSFFLQANKPELSSWVYDNALILKGLLFWSSQKIRKRILNSDDEELKKQFQIWQEQRNYLAQVYNLSNAEKQKQGIDENALRDLEKAANDTEKKLSEKSQLFRQNTELRHYTWRDVQKQLKPKEAAIEIIRTRFFEKELRDSVLYIALIIKPEMQDHPDFVVLPNGQELEDKYLVYYRNAIKFKKSDQYSYAKYWQTIAEKLKGINKVYFSADGVYHQINLNTLKNPSTQKYLLEEIDIQQIGSTRDLIRKSITSSVAAKQNASLFLGRPKYDLDAQEHESIIQDISHSTRGQANTRYYTVGEKISESNWVDLTGTEQEVRQIHQIFQNQGISANLYLFENALEEIVKEAQNPRVLHIATHGFFLENLKTKLNAENNPMMRSGVVLAGVSSYTKNKEQYSQDNLSIEDGLLTAYESMNLDLDNTELVVLSACQTGQGKVQNGEGVYGLQRGFQAAGAKTVLMSLWNVSDEATQNLMIAFYENWIAKGLSKRKAFKAAQLAMKKKYKNPYYWGAFVMVGE